MEIKPTKLSLLFFSLTWFCFSLMMWSNGEGHKQTVNITQTTATLSQARYRLAATYSIDLVFFGGGYNATGPSERVDIYNVTSGNWTAATLSVPRGDLAATSSGNLVFFGGGASSYQNPPSTCYNQVDIYNTSDRNWSNATLTQARCCLAATSVGNLVFFAGGCCSPNGPNNPSNVVDIYNVTNNMWMTATLSQARYWLAATSVANRYALFAGGRNGTGASNIVDIFDLSTGMWNTTTLSQARYWHAATSLGNLSFFGGGYDGNQTLNVVDIFYSTTQTWSTATLSQARYQLAAASVEDIVAFGGGSNGSSNLISLVDIFNVTAGIWLTVTMSAALCGLAATSTKNVILFGGGGGICNIPYNVVNIFQTPFQPQSSFAPVSLVAPISSSASPVISANVSSLEPMIFPTWMPSNERGLSTTPASGQMSSSFSALELKVILGTSLGIAVIVAAVIFVIFMAIRKRQRKTQSKNRVSLSDETTGTVITKNDTKTKSNSETKTVSLFTHRFETETLKGLSPGQISFSELEIDKEIGMGCYGRVCVGKWKKYRVALKFCHNRGKMDEFMREANLMISLPPHPNVVRMYGVSIDGTQPIIVMEYCAGGSLDMLLYHKEQQISDEQKIHWVYEIAKGMGHLHTYNIIHRDIAARNILLTHPNPSSAHLKISDFGMSRLLQKETEKTKSGTGPVCWMAPESLQDKVYSKKSDVWMFGMLVYEIVSRNEPHADKNPRKASTEIRDHFITPEIPVDCPPKLRQLMQMCWNKKPEQRPPFESICKMLEEN